MASLCDAWRMCTIVTPFMDVLFGVINTRTLRKFTVSYSDTSKRFINVHRCASSNLAFDERN